MGKKTKERKLAKLELLMQEKQAIEARRAEKLQPVYRTTKKFVMAVIGTAVLLYLGVLVSAHLPGVLRRLSGEG
jgi:hypothetical protein